MPATLRHAVVAVLVLASLIFFVRFLGCHNSGSDSAGSSITEQPLSKAELSKAAIEKVLKLDRFTGFEAESATNVIYKMRQIDLGKCPSDFRAAYVQHIHAWEELVSLEQEVKLINGRMTAVPTVLESFIRGFVFDFSMLFEANDQAGELQQRFIAGAEKVRDSFQKVEKIAVGYGVMLPPMKAIEWSGTCTQEGRGEYPMHMKMEVGPNGQVVGTLHWPELNDSKTKFRGKIRNGRLTFTENELLSSGYGIDWLAGKGVALPCDYDARVSGSRMSGTATYKNITAEFSVEVSSGMPAILAEF